MNLLQNQIATATLMTSMEQWLARSLAGRSTRPKPLFDSLPQTRARMLLHARVELGVVACCQAMRLPKGSAGALFKLATCAGWTAHVL
jgi:hypothetical protein